MGRLDQKVALITGAGAGLGAQIARRFKEEGAKLIINDVSDEAAQSVAKEVAGVGIAADVSDSNAVRRMLERVKSEFGRLDILVNNAGFGITPGDDETVRRINEVPFQQQAELEAGGPVQTHFDLTVEMTDEDWQRMINVHLNGTFYCSREALKIMNGQLSGSIINMGSIMGTTGGIGTSYCAAKAGILGFTRSLAREVVSRGIRVNALAPGFIDTELTKPFGSARALLEAQTPMGKFGDCDDIAWPAVYLASDEAKYMTGQVISPNGGFVMSQ
ncbi:MAG: 3-oxoacyl-ACP reductase FabG [Pseudomonadales bacterium]|nr:3-oxoacyl-ACP reductase FabG [Halioglobus sp.]MCP5129917.1 3-oxoacyl-ACP reductase FabG [Pseudomonadales bacterium]